MDLEIIPSPNKKLPSGEIRKAVADAGDWLLGCKSEDIILPLQSCDLE